MKTEEKTSMGEVGQVVFRPSAECRGYYRFHYGYLAPDGSFIEDVELCFWDFLDNLDVPFSLVETFVESFSGSEMEVCNFGYFLQEHFNQFARYFAASCASLQLYPGMLVYTFNKRHNEG